MTSLQRNAAQGVPYGLLPVSIATMERFGNDTSFRHP